MTTSIDEINDTLKLGGRNTILHFDENTPDSIYKAALSKIGIINADLKKENIYLKKTMNEIMEGKFPKSPDRIFWGLFPPWLTILLNGIGTGTVLNWIFMLIMFSVDTAQLLRTPELTKERATATVKLMGKQYVENHSEAQFNANKKIVAGRVHEWRVMQEGREEIFGKKVLDGSQ